MLGVYCVVRGSRSAVTSINVHPSNAEDVGEPGKDIRLGGVWETFDVLKRVLFAADMAEREADTSNNESNGEASVLGVVEEDGVVEYACVDSAIWSLDGCDLDPPVKVSGFIFSLCCVTFPDGMPLRTP